MSKRWLVAAVITLLLGCGSGTSAGSDAAPGADATAGADAGADTGAGDGPGPGGSDAGDAGGPVTRPSYNTGVGFFTLNGKLYDANGVEFHIKGVNTCHYDESWASCTSNCGLSNSHANVNRIGTPLWPSIAESTLRHLMDLMISNHIVPLPGVWYTDGSYSDSANVTCKDAAGAGSAFETAVEQWIARAALFKPYERYLLLNIANEWGPSDSAAWRDAYIDAVGRLRTAGYLCTLVIDAGGCGQDVSDLATYAQAVYAADPQQNIVFGEHVYGQWATAATGEQSWQTDLYIGFQAMKDTGLPILIGELGPGRNVGPSPTMVTPGTVIQAADAQGFGWLAWAWDDAYGSGDFNLSNQGAFSLTAGAPTNGAYPNNTDLTAYGNEVVLHPSYGLFASARPATIFP
jgi:mannan endo-1,4-beta-mannosidase